MNHRSVYCVAPSLELADGILGELHRTSVSFSDVSALLLDQVGGAAPAQGENGPRVTLASLPELGPLVVAGFPPLLAHGPLATVLQDTASAGLAASLVNFGVPELEASLYEGKIRQGGVLISLRAKNPDQSDGARTIFRTAGAEDIRTVMVLVKRGTKHPHEDSSPAVALAR